MSVLFVSPLLDGTGYSRAGIDYVLALDAAGVDVVPRALKLNDERHEPPARVRELMARPASGYNVVIQHCLPHQLSFSGSFGRNVALFAWETSNFLASSWADRLNCVDEVWAINAAQRTACLDSGVTVPVRVVPHASDVTRFQQSRRPLDCLAPHKQEGLFLFYSIGEFVRRKNFAGLLRAFHAEFDPYEPVGLILKTSVPGLSTAQSLEQVRAFCGEVRKGLKLPGGHHRPEIILTERLGDEEMLRLHASCDCYVTASYGEAWAIPAFDAMGMGKTPIAPASTGFLDYLSDAEGWPVGVRDEPVFGVLDSFEDLYTGGETWAAPDLLHLRRCMREAYEDSTKRESKAARGIERAYDFSHPAVGKIMKAILNEPRQLEAAPRGGARAGP